MRLRYRASHLESLNIRSIEDFHPDRLIQQLPNIQCYLRIKKRLTQLKSRLLNKQQRAVIAQVLQRDLNELIDVELCAKDEKDKSHGNANPS